MIKTLVATPDPQPDDPFVIFTTQTSVTTAIATTVTWPVLGKG